MTISSLKPRITSIDMRQGASPGIKRIVGREHGRIRDRILERDCYTCRKCGREVLNTAWLVVDHKVPLHLGGAESDENRWLLCLACHKIKSDEEEKERGR